MKGTPNIAKKQQHPNTNSQLSGRIIIEIIFGTIPKQIIWQIIMETTGINIMRIAHGS